MRCLNRLQIGGIPLQSLFQFNGRSNKLCSSKIAHAQSITIHPTRIAQQPVPDRAAVSCCLPGRVVVQFREFCGGILSPISGSPTWQKEFKSAPECSHPGAVTMRHSGEMAGEQRDMSVEERADGELPEQGSGKRFAVLMAGHAPDGAVKKYGGYGEMFVHLLSDPGETWDIFAVIEGKFPTEKELESYDGFVVTGSRHDAHGSEPWIEKLCEVLRDVHAQRKRTLGVCFGHQVLSRALGGITGRSSVGWEIGLKEVTVSEALRAKSYGSGLPRVLRILEIHRDAVSRAPPGAEVLAWSEKTGIEMFCVGEHALGIQGHPEFTRDVEEELLDSRLALGVFQEEEVNEAKKSMDQGQADAETLKRLCKTFLKGNGID